MRYSLIKGVFIHQLRLKTRKFSTLKGTSFGVQCSRYGCADDDRILIERSLQNGCRTILTRSSEALVKNYELLADIKATDDLDWSTYMIGHMFYPKFSKEPWTPSGLIDLLESDLKSIESSFKMEGVSLLSIPFDDYVTCPDLLNILLSRKAINPNIKLAFEYKLNYLEKTSAFHVFEGLTKHSDVISDHISCFVISMNGFTSRRALKFAEIARQKNIKVIAIDTLTAHRRRPGTICFQSLLARNFAKVSMKNDKIEAATLDLLKEFDSSLEKVISMERKYLEKFESRKVIDANDILIGHSINNNLSTVLLPEEWSVIKRIQVKPLLESTIQKLKTADHDLRDWAILYGTMINYLFNSYEKILHIRKAHQCLDMYSVISSEPNLSELIDEEHKLSQLPPLLMKLNEGLGSDYVCGEGLVIDIPKLTSLKTPSYQDAEKSLKGLGRILDEYSLEFHK